MTLKQSTAPTIALQGSVERVTFHSEASGFCVLRIKAKGQRELVTVVGHATAVNPGEFIECEGHWIHDQQHGLQFRAEQLRLVPPSTIEGIQKYLASGLIKGVGPHYAQRLIRAFGVQVFEVIEKEPQRLATVSGFGRKRCEQVQKAWAEQNTVRDIMVFLQSYGVGTARAVRIFKVYGDTAIDKVRENPYRLALDISGIGFKTADQLAMRLGIPADSVLRARAGLRHTLQTLASEGHCAAPRSVLLSKANALLSIVTAILEEALAQELAQHLLVAVSNPSDAEPLIYTQNLYQAEQKVGEHLVKLSQGVVPWKSIDASKAIPWVEKLTGLQLALSQQEAVRLALVSKVMIITGGPGVGKTTILKSIIKIIHQKKMNIALAAPTGRAAKRLSESTHMQAKTLHRLLEFDPTRFRFRFNENEPLHCDYVIVDEVSMVDIVLMHQLLQAIPAHAGVLFVGDVDQLPSVGPGAVLKDMIDSKVLPVVKLTEIFRQAKHSHIIVNAHRINQGESPFYNQNKETLSDFYVIPCEEAEDIQKTILQLVCERIPQRFHLDPKNDIQILTPMKRGGLGSQSMNLLLQHRLNGQAEPKFERFGNTYAPGDKVIQIINNYDKEVFNGDIGIIKRVSLGDRLAHIDFDGRVVDYDFAEFDELTLAYAISIHKSQGSEYPCVIIPLATSHFTMLMRNLLYTGVTRGKKLVIIVGQPKAVAMAIRNTQSTQRVTRLACYLRAKQGAIESVGSIAPG